MAKMVVRVLTASTWLILLLGLGFPGCLSRPGIYINLIYMLAAVFLSLVTRAVEKALVKPPVSPAGQPVRAGRGR